MPDRRYDVERWRDGADGERRTARRLRGLAKSGWAVRHDVRWGEGNLDHLVVGPAGVFVLDSKNWRHGTIAVVDGMPTVERPYSDAMTYRTVPGRMRALAAEVKAAVEQQSGERLWVSAVVVIWGDFPQQVVEADKVAYVHGDRLAAWLAERPAVRAPSRLAAVTRALG